MNKVLPQAVIERNFPIQTRSQIVKTVHLAYKMVDQLMTTDPFLGSILSRMNLSGHLRSTGVEFSLERACLQGILPCKGHLKLNHQKNCMHLELEAEDIILTANRVQYHDAVPRDAIFRNQLRGSNQLRLPIFMEEEPSYEENKILYGCITHGSRSNAPEFVCIGIPHPEENTWLYRKNLMLEPFLVSEDTSPSEADVADAVIKFKAHIEQHLSKKEKNDDNDNQ